MPEEQAQGISEPGENVCATQPEAGHWERIMLLVVGLRLLGALSLAKGLYDLGGLSYWMMGQHQEVLPRAIFLPLSGCLLICFDQRIAGWMCRGKTLVDAQHLHAWKRLGQGILAVYLSVWYVPQYAIATAFWAPAITAELTMIPEPVPDDEGEPASERDATTLGPGASTATPGKNATILHVIPMGLMSMPLLLERSGPYLGESSSPQLRETLLMLGLLRLAALAALILWLLNPKEKNA